VCVLQRFSHMSVIEPLESFKHVLSRQLVAGSDHKTFERLEPCVGKLTSTVLRGVGGSNATHLLDPRARINDPARQSAVRVRRASTHPSAPVVRAIASGSRPRPLVAERFQRLRQIALRHQHVAWRSKPASPFLGRPRLRFCGSGATFTGFSLASIAVAQVLDRQLSRGMSASARTPRKFPLKAGTSARHCNFASNSCACSIQ
jgi:hypothetical protein